MTDVVTTAAVCVGTGAVSSFICASIGFDPRLLIGGTIGGFIGCLIVQTLIPVESDPVKAAITFAGYLKIMVGSVLLATILTMICSPALIRAMSLQDVPPGAVRIAVGAVIGAMAQPIVVLGRKKFIKWLGKWDGTPPGPATKESGDA